MWSRLTSSVALVSGLLLQTAQAQVQSYSSSGGIALALRSVTNGTGHDLQFQLSVPSGASWGGIGIGEGMAGALYFILYPNAAGTGATVSVRTASGEVMPREVAGINYDVTSTSVDGSNLIADVICYSCTWPTLDFTTSNSDWMWAVGPSGSISSDSTSENIARHSRHGEFSIDLAASVVATTATDGTTTAEDGTAGTSTTGGLVAPTGTTGEAAGNSGGGSNTSMLVLAHAVLLPLAFLFFLPLAVLLLRFASVRLHYMATMIGTALALAGLAIGIIFTIRQGRGFGTGHQIIGLVAVGLLPLQGLGGAVHHWLYKKNGKATIISLMHVWTGRVAVLLGMLNISLGFLLEDSIVRAAALGAVSAVVYIVTFGVAIWRGRSQKKRALSEKTRGSASD